MPRGKSTLAVEVSNVSGNGFWLLLDDRELFVGFDQFPWFLEAGIRQLLNVERPHPEHLYWPDLDVDLDLQSIEHPEAYPLLDRALPPTRQSRPEATTKPRTAPKRARRSQPPKS